MLKNAPFSSVIREVARKDLSAQKSRLSLKSDKNRNASKTKPKEREK
jgi:hypothetical protein